MSLDYREMSDLNKFAQSYLEFSVTWLDLTNFLLHLL